MAQDVISTLFGITPRNAAFDQYTQERMIDVNKAGAQYADLGRANIERASAMMQNAGTGLGIGLGRLLGGQTPQMAEEQRVQGMLGGASLQDPEQLMMAAERFAQAGDIPRAQALAGQAQALKTRQEEQARARETQQADLLKKQADADKIRSEMEMKQVAYQNRFRALKAKFKDIPDEVAQALALSETSFNEAIKAPKANTQFVTSGGRVVLRDKDTGAEILDVGAAPDNRSVTKVTVNGREEQSAFAKKLGEIQGNRMLAAYDKRDAARRELTTFEELAKLPDDKLISGSFADERVGVANFLNTIGLASKEDAAKVAASQQFGKLSGDLVLARVKQLGYNPSDADRKFIEKTIPSLNSSAAARKALLDFMARVARDVSDEVTSMEEYATTNETLTGYKPKIPQVSMVTPAKSVSNMTDEELLKALQNSKK